MTLYFDDKGVQLADVPNAGASRVDPNAVSGNPRHDVRSGKFGSGGGGQQRGTPPPANVDPLEWARMQDAVRDAAREFDDFDEGDVAEFLKARARDPSVVDNAAFLLMVRQQHINDIADILDQQLRTSGSLPSGKRKVRVSAPRGYMKRALAGLNADEVAQVMSRLEARGHDRTRVDDFFDRKKIGTPEAKGKRDAVAATAFDATTAFKTDPLASIIVEQPDGFDVEALGDAIAEGLTKRLIQD